MKIELYWISYFYFSAALSLVVGQEAVHKGFSLMLDSLQDKELNK